MDCTWNEPGQNKFTGLAEVAIRAYQDIPEANQNELIRKVKSIKYDDVAEITNTGIYSRHFEYKNLRNMWFGNYKVCSKINYKWKEGHIERAMVFSSGVYQIIVPFVCGNIARVDKARLVSKSDFKPIPEPSSLALVILAGIVFYVTGLFKRTLVRVSKTPICEV